MSSKIKLGFKKNYLFKASACKIKGHKIKLFLSKETLIIKQEDNLYRMLFESIENIKMTKKMWYIRVSLMYEGKKYNFDFQNLKKAKNFYEKLIYCKVKAALY